MLGTSFNDVVSDVWYKSQLTTAAVPEPVVNGLLVLGVVGVLTGWRSRGRTAARLP